MSGNGNLVILALQKRLVRKFQEAGATRPRQAAPLPDLGVRRSFVFKKLLKKGILREAEGERYYLDEEAAGRHFRRARIGIFTAVGIALFVLLVYLIFGVWLG